jgi:arginyl-tRNA synthetase
LRKAGEQGIGVEPRALLAAGSFEAAGSEPAFALLKLIGTLPEIIAEAGEKYEPSLITRHVTDIAQAFSVFYHEEPILSDGGDSRLVKLAITAAAKQAIKNGLALIGVGAPERM